MTSSNESFPEQAKRIKGYGFPDYEEQFFKSKMQSDPNYKLEEKRRHELEELKCSGDGKHTVRPIVVESLEAFVSEITKLESNQFNPILYRGHTNANCFMLPSVMRLLSEKEDLLYQEFCRRFPKEIQQCENAMEKLVFMQHYYTKTRALDLTENPLFALFFACADDKRFRTNLEGNKYKWGEVVLVRAPETEENKKNLYRDDIKYPHSSTVSVLANTGFMEKDFNLLQLQIAYQNDRHLANLNNFVYLRDVLSRSVIVRTKQDNPRIQHQQGAFLLVNANTIDYISCVDTGEKVNVDVKQLTDYVLGGAKDAADLNLAYLQKGLYKQFSQFSKDMQYDIHFKKVAPYAPKNSDPRMQNDPFDLRRFLYKNASDEQVVFLIPPTAKDHIKKQLARLNITDAFVYPEMDSVSNELYELFTVQ